ncbi:FLYWCH zinc finger domain-containing protein [Phthorimaea operculella]|nr:FLYWCH zinc finger domain-containing protein [Phthorimaea operculella]
MSWPCLKKTWKCRARLTTTIEGKLIKANVEHNHPPPRFIIRNVAWVENTSGKKMGIYQGHSFYRKEVHQSTIHWPCLKAPTKCRARLVTSIEGTLIRANAEHNHPPPRFIIRNVMLTTVFNSSGKILAIVDNYTFYNNSQGLSTNNWACTSSGKGLPVFTTSSFGNPLMKVGKYNFGLHPCNKKPTATPRPTLRWRCNSRGCKVFVITHNNEIIRYGNEHNH